MKDDLESKFENPEKLLIYKKKKSSLLHYNLEANIQHLNWMYLKNLRELLQEGYKISKIPEILQKLIKVDSTLILSVLLITGLKLYSKLTKHKIEFI